MPLRHVIVGSGIAGLSAAEVLRQNDAEAAITIISEEAHDFYSRPGLAYLLRGDIPERQLFIRSKRDVRAMALQRIHAVADSLGENQEVVLRDGRRVAYDRLLLATGALAAPPAFPGSELAGIVKLDGLDDTRRILKLARRGQPAVVIGGGVTALELAEGLRARGMRVHYLLRKARFWGNVLDEVESDIVMDRLRREGIILRANTQVKQAIGDKGRVIAVETLGGETIPCRILAVATGVRARVDLTRKAGSAVDRLAVDRLAVDKGIVVDAHMQTSLPNVFAAGDCAQVGDAPLDVLWPTASAQGRIAGMNMAGCRVPYVKGVACNATMLAGLKVTIIGNVGSGAPGADTKARGPLVGAGRDGKLDDDVVSITRGESESWRINPDALVLSRQDAVGRVRLAVGRRTIVGAVVMGDQSWSRPLQELIAARADISAIRDDLPAEGSANLELLAEFYKTCHSENKTDALAGV
jgi:NADPH-dependent 2,4-dienoyl-CoA reductase/sulfur reductase-like enzyme